MIEVMYDAALSHMHKSKKKYMKQKLEKNSMKKNKNCRTNKIAILEVPEKLNNYKNFDFQNSFILTTSRSFSILRFIINNSRRLARNDQGVAF